MKVYDVIVIGAGPGGYETAAKAAAMGKKTMIAERAQLGGTCLNRGCIPTKALSRSAEVALLMRRAEEFGIKSSGLSVDYSAVAARKDAVVAALREGVAIELQGVDVVYGEASFVGESVVEVNDELYTAQQIIIATGSRSAVLDIPGAELTIDSDKLLSLTELPESMVIIGGGVIGMEFASILQAFGVNVTVIEYCKEILPGFDSEVAKRLRMILKRRGVNIVTSARVIAVEQGITVRYIQKDKEKSVAAQIVLMAVGRRPVLPLGLDEAGVAVERGAIVVDETMATRVPGIYAIGDVNGRCMLAHAATAQGAVALGLIRNLNVIPSAVFTVPECATVGLTEEKCQAQGLDYLTGEMIYRANGKAQAMGETEGLVKVLVDAKTHHILGGHICGEHASDLIQEIALAMSAGVTADTLVATVHSHPSLSEIVHSAIIKAVR
ncbi:MAG: dihydrolipoyl dehydrogenase [Paramuribaculum sp.]|nr:dihydrolipoyl dehydrogenase [Paramuribaculum sp.]